MATRRGCPCLVDRFTKNIASCDFFLAGLRRLVLRFASCEAVLGEPGSAKVEETRRMSDLLCVPFRPGWQVGSSERRNLYRPRRRVAD